MKLMRQYADFIYFILSYFCLLVFYLQCNRSDMTSDIKNYAILFNYFVKKNILFQIIWISFKTR